MTDCDKLFFVPFDFFLYRLYINKESKIMGKYIFLAPGDEKWLLK